VQHSDKDMFAHDRCGSFSENAADVVALIINRSQ
jgi:hypothetical protein